MRVKLYASLLILICSFLTSKVSAQTVNQYIYSTSTGATLDPMAGATTIVAASVDDVPSTLQNIGFTFNYAGVNYTQYSASPDGFIRLGSPAASSQFTNSIVSTTNVPKLFPMWDDLATGVGGSVRAVVTGISPNRILKVEWFVTIPRNTTGAANSRFQAWLYEGSNVIEFRYGTGGNPGSASVGINGTAPATQFQSITTSSHAVSTVTANNTNTAWPGSGRMYTFTPPSGPNMISAGATIIAENCVNGALDPGETVTVSLCVSNNGADPTVNLVGTLQATGGVTGPSGPQNYGVVAVGATVCRNFTFMVTGSCGSTVTASLQLQDGANNLGTLTYTFTLGTLNTILSQNFDAVVAPTLPAGWTTSSSGAAAVNWVTSSAGTPTPAASSAPNSAFVPNNGNIGDNLLVSPSITITGVPARITFRNNFNLESGFDGGVLEIAVGAGAFQDILASGATFATGGYTGTISTSFGNPLGGRQAWTGSSAGFITTTVNLPNSMVGQTIRLRFREGTDNSVTAQGWRVDDVVVTAGYNCCIPPLPCDENFDALTVPALPQGWSATTGADCAGSNPWATVGAGASSAPNAAFVNDPNCISDEYLLSVNMLVTSATASVTFQNSYALENTFDGMVLEISVNGGAFQDIIAAGGSFGAGGYNGTISTAFGSPIGGRSAWTGNSGGYITTTANLPASANGQAVRLRWRRATDSSVSGTGVFIDNVTFSGLDCQCRVTCPANITVGNDVNQCGAVVNYPTIQYTGACGVITASPASGSFFPVGNTVVTVTGGLSSCTFIVRVNDTQPPTITCPANITTGSAPGQCGATVNFAAPSASDNCPGVTVVSVPASGSFFPVGTTTVTSTATDAAGNTSTCSFTVTVNDTQPPTITCPANVTVNNTPGLCTGIATYTLPSATDNCAPAGTVTDFSQTWTSTGQRGVYFDVTNIGGSTITINALNPAMWGTGPLTDNFTIYFTTSASTWNGNEGNAGAWTLNTTQSVNFPGGANPVQVSIPLTTPITLTPGQSRGVYVVGTQSFGGGPVAYLSTPAYAGPQSYQDANLRFTGGIGSSGLFSGFFGTGLPGNFRLYYGSISYTSPISVTQTAGLPSGSAFPVGTTTNTFQTTDGAGNTSTCSFTVTVVDNQAPTITCPANMTVTTPIGSCTALVNYNVTAADNCPGVTTALIGGLASGSQFPLGVNTVTWRATDAAGNTSQCSFTVTVLDGQLPVISQQPTNITSCVGNNPTFSVVSTNVVTYQWQTFSGGTWNNIPGATSSTYTVNNATTAMNTNTFRVILQGLCTTVTSNMATLFVNTLPTITLHPSIAPFLTPGQTMSITATGMPPGGNYQWFLNGNPIAGASGNVITGITINEQGNYTVRYTDPNGCVQTSSALLVTGAQSENMWVYPNPNFGQFNVRFFNSNPENATVNVYNSKGQKVYSKSMTTTLPYTIIDIDLGPTAKNGIYVVELVNGQGDRVGAAQVVVRPN